MATSIHPPDVSGIDLDAEVVVITPLIAKNMLATNDGNRNIRQQAVAAYAHDMTAGDWRWTGDPIRFAVDGALIDGQHRLSAIVLANVSIPMLVIRGIDPEAQGVMDTGAKRNAGDMLYMYGVTNAKNTAALARMVIVWNKGAITTSASHGTGEVTHSQVLRAVEADPSIQWAVTIGMASYQSIKAQMSAISFATWLAGKQDQDGIAGFLKDVSELRTNGYGDPRFTLIKRLDAHHANKDHVKAIEKAWLICRAYDAYRKGDQLKMLKTVVNGAPMPFPDFSTP